VARAAQTHPVARLAAAAWRRAAARGRGSGRRRLSLQAPVKVFDNSNTGGVLNGGKSPTFDKGQSLT
jgi:hypothetical protein